MNIKINSILLYVIVPITFISCRQQEKKNIGEFSFEDLPDLTKRISGVVINGKKQGLWINYDDSGRVTSYNSYLDDILTGESISYFADGTISSKGILINGEREGEWTFYFDKDKIAEKGSYHLGNRVGIWEYYILEGNLDRLIEFSNDGEEKVIKDNHLSPPLPIITKEKALSK